MKEMIYLPKMLKQPERLAEGEHRGLTYYVLTLGTHPCAYVDVTGTLLDGKNDDDIEIDCHYGLTYAEPHLSTVDTGGWFIGWDYGHYCDFAGYTLEMSLERQTGKKWTTEEMVAECKDVIDQIIDKGFANRKQTVGEWISVEERLPETYGGVICYTECGYVSQLVYNPQYKLFNVSADNVECAIAVTHWMPLPEPPKMKGGVE